MFPTGRNFASEFKSSYVANGKFAKYEFRLLNILRNLSMMAYITESQKSKFANV